MKSVKIELRSLFVTDGAKKQISFDLDLSDTEISGFYPLQKPVHFEGGVFNRTGVVTFEGHAECEYDAPCDRCGTDCSEKVATDIAYTLVTRLNDEEREDYLEVPDYTLDAESVVRTDVLLSLPTKHLCSPECKGLCSNCGANLNKGSCSCKTTESNPFADALSKFFD